MSGPFADAPAPQVLANATPNFIGSASGLRRPSKRPFPWSRTFVPRALRAALPGRTEALPLARHPLRLGDLSGRHRGGNLMPTSIELEAGRASG